MELCGIEIVYLSRDWRSGGAVCGPGDVAVPGPLGRAFQFLSVWLTREVSEIVAVGTFGLEPQLVVFERAFQF